METDGHMIFVLPISADALREYLEGCRVGLFFAPETIGVLAEDDESRSDGVDLVEQMIKIMQEPLTSGDD